MPIRVFVRVNAFGLLSATPGPERAIGTEADLHQSDRQAGWNGVPQGEASWPIRLPADSLHAVWSPDARHLPGAARPASLSSFWEGA